MDAVEQTNIFSMKLLVMQQRCDCAFIIIDMFLVSALVVLTKAN